MIDPQLIRQVQKGDRKAMQQLYSITVRYLCAVCQRYVVNDEDVRDVVQETYIKVFQSIGKYEPHEGTSIRSWMARIAVNESLMLIRQKDREAFVSTQDEVPDTEEEIEISRFSPDELHQAIQQLPTGYRIVLNLYVFEQQSHREIARTLGIKESTSASQFSRAKCMLRKILLQQEGALR